ncbi:MAG TPA: biosynthetic arginine decarboxylase [Crenotrichaceae bacterium]|nr:biosynthetic arginine decarboxylase [Crenotrichaceae bacterium]
MNWTIQNARETYNIGYWSGGYFDIDDSGHLIATPGGDNPVVIDCISLSRDIKNAGLSLPVLVRFPEILHQRVKKLCSAFESAMVDAQYQGQFTAVYPIKVNQQRSVVEEILRGDNGQVGLEAGSKPELMHVLALSDQNGGVVICNGYKDREYIRLALIGQQLGHDVCIVLERLSELSMVIEEARDLGVTPKLGVRVRLTAIGMGKWQNSGGEKAKFGLSATQILDVVDRLRHANMLDTLQLLHFHLGSQISNIRDIQRGLHEAARFYAEFHRLGVNIRAVDVGGGLGVDYEGTRSRSFCSMNYSMREYAQNIVRVLCDVCDAQGLKHPDIITESGRAMTAHHAMLITNVIDVERRQEDALLLPPNKNDPHILHDLWKALQRLPLSPALEIYHDVVHYLDEAQAMYVHGVLTLEQRAQAEQLYFVTCKKVQLLLRPELRAHREVLDELNEKLADKYFCNFSLFQSLPDAWAIDQVFPIVPLQRLNEKPTRRAIIHDITCDSDGRIDYYVDEAGIESSLPLHSIDLSNNSEPYLLGIFLVGAYQEILGDMHNLFGDTHSVNVELDDDGGYCLTQVIEGDMVDSVLNSVRFDIDELMDIFQKKVKSASLDNNQRMIFMQALKAGMSGYTYLEDE